MALTKTLYTALSKSFKYDSVKAVKRNIRPLKHKLLGTHGVYKAIELTQTLEKNKGKDVLTVFDIGAADGEYALTFAESFPKATLYCFEPQNGSRKKLAKKMSPYGSRTHLERNGFYNESKEISLHVDLDHPDGSTLLDEQGIKREGSETIQVLRLDDFVKERNITHIEFMKIDVEGVEKEVVEGGMETLMNKVDNLFIEISLARKGRYSRNYIDILDMLHRAGFALVDISDTENFFFSKLV